MNGFCLECQFILEKCWFEVGQSKFKHPVGLYFIREWSVAFLLIMQKFCLELI